jgi:hypothetical protein
MTSRFLLLYLFSIGFCTLAQSSKFKLNGAIINHTTGKKESGVQVVLYQNGAQIKQISTGTDGTYALEQLLDVTKTFEVVYQKTGFFSKRVLFNLTKTDPSKLTALDPIDISMVSKSVGNDLSFLETEPLQKITNVPLTSEDIQYRDNMQTKIYAALSSQNKKPNPTNEIYDRGLNKAWDLINEGKLEEAKKLAENYVVLNPKHPEPQKILAEINRRKGITTSTADDTTRQKKDSIALYVQSSQETKSINELKKQMSLNQRASDLQFNASRQTMQNDFNAQKDSVSSFADSSTRHINEMKRVSSLSQRDYDLQQTDTKTKQSQDFAELKKSVTPFPSGQDEQRGVYRQTASSDTLERKIDFPQNELGKQYPEGVTKGETQIIKDKERIVCIIETRYVVRYGQGSEYRKITGPGISSYTKDGESILPGEWQRATRE